MDLALPCFQAKDSDDEEEVVHVDRDHFMDEFFEQVELPVSLDWNLGPSQQRPLSCAHSLFPAHSLAFWFGLCHQTLASSPGSLIWPTSPGEVSLTSCLRWKRSEAASRNCLRTWSR